jgi:hypothetical protein
MTEPVSDVADKPSPEPTASKFGVFIQTYHGFLSSFVIGAAGLIATSVWQYRQSEVTAAEARSAQAIATTKAENDWRIARADILSKNLGVLATQGPSTADQRFGVLLSLARGGIIDPELAVAYALELGRDNPTFMRTILANTPNKNYEQLAQAFKLTCLQRLGLQRGARICTDDALSDRSAAIADLVREELDRRTDSVAGPLSLLNDERAVRAAPARLAWLFTPYLESLYEERKWQDITHFESSSPGARLVTALVFAATAADELATKTEAAALETFRVARRNWLVSYVFGPGCDPTCRGNLVDVIMSAYFEAQGAYDEPLRRLLLQPRAEAGPTLGHLRIRLLLCQVDQDDLSEFRDRALIPALSQALADPKADPAIVEDLVALLALVPDPHSTDAKAWSAWNGLQTALGARGGRLQRVFLSRRATAARERMNPSFMIKKGGFCNAPSVATTAPQQSSNQ